jgi:hypothetical protein
MTGPRSIGTTTATKTISGSINGTTTTTTTTKRYPLRTAMSDLPGECETGERGPLGRLFVFSLHDADERAG